MECGDPLLLEGEKLDWTINKLKEVRKKDKKLVFLSPYMIELFYSKEHYKDCFFRGRHFISFDANMNIKKPCTLGKGVNCKTCGCIVPIMSQALKKVDLRAFVILDKVFPARYYDD